MSSQETGALIVNFDADKIPILSLWKRKIAGNGITIKQRIQELVKKDLEKLNLKTGEDSK